ncbi:hypothetical protein BYT27DRAFT_7196058 [Phlegmacium glaucopus]|nr:hypothetical protein BYT27DRAFT_7196058 [Phlegmacium glaucopus]
MCLTLLLCTLSGTIGCAVLLHNHVDLGGIDVLHATRAGILGGVILGPGWSIGFPLALSLAVHLILLPLRIATLFGAKWLWVRSSESWTERGGYSYAVCVCAGGIQEDEIKESFVKVKSGLSLCM